MAVGLTYEQLVFRQRTVNLFLSNLSKQTDQVNPVYNIIWFLHVVTCCDFKDDSLLVNSKDALECITTGNSVLNGKFFLK